MAAAPDTADTAHEPGDDWVTVLTTLPTLPLPPNSARAAVETERLVLRPPTEQDLAALHALRTQAEVMRNTKRGRIDDDAAMTRARLAEFLPPRDASTFNCAISRKGDPANTLIGIGGVHAFRSDLGWPELGYMFHSAHWGQGYATEFLRAFVQLYARLPRPAAPVPLRVARASLPAALLLADSSPPAPPPVAEEILVAVVPDFNAASQKVVAKAGFDVFLSQEEWDKRNPDDRILLHYFRYCPGRQPPPPTQIEGQPASI